MGSRRSSSLEAFYQLDEYEKDLNEYISDTEEDEIITREPDTSSSSSGSMKENGEDHTRRNLNMSFIEVWEALRKDISEMEKEGLIKKGSVLATMVDKIESIRMNVSGSVEENYFSFDEQYFSSSNFMDNYIEKYIKDEEMWTTEEKEERFVIYDDFYFKEDGNITTKMSEVIREGTFSENHQPTEIFQKEIAEREIITQGGPIKIWKEKKIINGGDMMDKKENLDDGKEEKHEGSKARKCESEIKGNAEDFAKDEKLLGLNGQHAIQMKHTEVVFDKNFKKIENLMETPANELSVGLNKSSEIINATERVSQQEEIEQMVDLDEMFCANEKKRKDDERQERVDDEGKGSETTAVEISQDCDEFSKETWYYDEIDDNEEACKEEKGSVNIKENRVCKYPLTRQQRMERSYEIRKEKAWKNWLSEKDKAKRQKALLEIQCVMLAQSTKKKKPHYRITEEEKKAEAKLLGRLQREKNIAERIALEDMYWKKRMEEWKRRWEGAEAVAAKRWQLLLNPPLPQTKFDCKKKEKERSVLPCRISAELKAVEELPNVDLSDMVVKKPAQERKSHSEGDKIEEEEYFPKEEEKEVEMKDIEKMEMEDEEIMMYSEKNCEDQTVKLFNIIDIPSSLADEANKFDWNERMNRHSDKKTTIGRFQVTPKEVIFKDFIPKMTYRSRITICNLDMQTRQLCVVGLWYSDKSLFGQGILEFDESLGNLPRIVRIRPGLTFDIWLVFKPRSIADSTAVFAQVALIVAQGPLMAGKDEWARLNRAIIPDKVKDAGYMFISVQCKNARPDPQVTRQIVILDIYPQADNEAKTTPTVSEEILANLPMQLKESQSVLSIKSTKSNASTLENKVTPRGIFAEKMELLSIGQVSELREVISDRSNVARKTMDDIFDVATSCFSCTPQYFGKLSAQSSTQITVKLQKIALSSEETKIMEKYTLYFDNNSKTPEIHIWICYRQCEIIEKISVKKTFIDFGICTAGGIYQDCLEVYNDYEYSRGIILSLGDFPDTQTICSKNPLHPHILEIIPKGLTFVQPHSVFPFTVRLIVGKADKNVNNEYLQQMMCCEELFFDLKMHKMIPKSQKCGSSDHLTKSLLCIIKVSAVLSDMASNPECPPLVLDPSLLNLGRCLTTETIKASFKIISNSRITLTYGFLSLPKYVTVQPGFGFGHILPQETISLDLLYSPLPEHGCTSPGKKFTFQLMCYNVLNKAKPDFMTTAEMKVEVIVVHIPDLHLSCSTLCFPATPCGSFSRTLITLTSTQDVSSNENTGKCKMQDKISRSKRELECLPGAKKTKQNSGYWYEFQSQSDEILIYPSHGYLGPGQSIKIHLLFEPKIEKGIIENKAKEMWKEYKKISAELELENEKKDNQRKEKKMKKEKKEIRGKIPEGNKNKPSIAQTKPSQTTSSSLKIQAISSRTSALKCKKKHSQTAPFEDESLLNEETKLLLPAENSLLEALQPYVCYNKIGCLVVKGHPSDSNGVRKVPEILLIEAICPVVRPGFLIREYGVEWMPKKQNSKLEMEVNLNESKGYQEKAGWNNLKTSHTQVVDFGAVAIDGGSHTLAITLQNISASSPLCMVPSLLNPLGPFSCPHYIMLQCKDKSGINKTTSQEKDNLNKKNEYSTKYDSFIVVPPENILRIPVTFTPDSDGVVKELMNIQGTSDQGIKTQITVELIGKGELPKFNVYPNPPVVTLRQLKGKTPKPSTIKIQNLCNATLDFHIGKIFPIIEQKKSKMRGMKANETEEVPNKELEKESKGTKGKIRTTEKNEDLLECRDEKKRQKVKHTGKSGKREEKIEMKVESIKEDEKDYINRIRREEENHKHETVMEEIIFSIDPPDFLRVNALSIGELNIFLLPAVEKMQKSFTFPLTLFGKGASVADVTVKVLIK